MCKIVLTDVGNRKVRVADIKKKYVKSIVDAAGKCDYIDKVVLFGSSIEDRCKDHSDIDIAVFWNRTASYALTTKKYENFARQLYSFDDYKQAYDILYFKTGSKNNSSIMSDIEKGRCCMSKQMADPLTLAQVQADLFIVNTTLHCVIRLDTLQRCYEEMNGWMV